MITIDELKVELKVDYDEVLKNTSKQRMKHFNNKFSVIIGYRTEEQKEYRKKFLPTSCK